MEKYDYEYDLTDEQLLYYSSLPAIAKLRWLEQARRFTLLARRARERKAADEIRSEAQPRSTARR